MWTMTGLKVDYMWSYRRVKTPDPVRSRKLSEVGPDLYLDGRPLMKSRKPREWCVRECSWCFCHGQNHLDYCYFINCFNCVFRLEVSVRGVNVPWEFDHCTSTTNLSWWMSLRCCNNVGSSWKSTVCPPLCSWWLKRLVQVGWVKK